VRGLRGIGAVRPFTSDSQVGLAGRRCGHICRVWIRGLGRPHARRRRSRCGRGRRARSWQRIHPGVSSQSVSPHGGPTRQSNRFARPGGRPRRRFRAPAACQPCQQPADTPARCTLGGGAPATAPDLLGRRTRHPHEQPLLCGELALSRRALVHETIGSPAICSDCDSRAEERWRWRRLGTRPRWRGLRRRHSGWRPSRSCALLSPLLLRGLAAGELGERIARRRCRVRYRLGESPPLPKAAAAVRVVAGINCASHSALGSRGVGRRS